MLSTHGGIVAANLERVFALGVDPGLSRCGYGVVGRGRDGLHVLSAGVIRTPPSDPLAARLAALCAELRQLLDETHPDVLVVERVLFHANARTAMAVGQASGPTAPRRNCRRGVAACAGEGD